MCHDPMQQDLGEFWRKWEYKTALIKEWENMGVAFEGGAASELSHIVYVGLSYLHLHVPAIEL